MSLHELHQFPQGFLWGSATSAHQVEGQNVNDWSRWEEIPGRIFKNQQSGLACDWWAGRFTEDFDRAAAMHNNAHRLSIEWSRIEPQPGRWDEQALDHYRQMLLALRAWHRPYGHAASLYQPAVGGRAHCLGMGRIASLL